MKSRSTDIVFLLGAGASVDAGIPMSGAMIARIERLLREDKEWQQFPKLYEHVKSAIHYAAGLGGTFGADVPYNIETFVNTLYELEKNEQHPLYPFIAAWNSRFVQLAGSDFRIVCDLRRQILKQLKKWMCPDDESLGRYYRGFIPLQADLNFPLHIFSLNYDLCVERLGREKDVRVETGFADSGLNHTWEWERFENSETLPSDPPQFFLYKLHGSINWKRDEANNLFSVDQIETVEADNMDVIFGRDFKLEAADPYLFYAYQFRRSTLAASLIVALGYSFGDIHINKMLAQALRSSPNRRLLAVSACDSDKKCEKKAKEVASRVGVDLKQVVVSKGTAKQFLEQDGLATKLLATIPKADDSPF